MKESRLCVFPMLNLTLRNKLLLFLLPVLLTFAFGIFGSEYSDQGFVRGFTWRILSGEIPYNDFIYPRPPMTLFMDLFFRTISPEFLGVFLERLRFYFQILLVVLLVFEKADFIQRAHLIPLILISYLLTLDCFPPTSWYTVDGVFFGALSFYFFSSDATKFKWCLFFAFCSALTKQSFYPLPLFLIVYSFIQFRFRTIKILFFGAIPLFSFLGYLFIFNNYAAFLSQTSGASKLQDLIRAGLFAYLRINTFKYLGFLGIGFYLFRKKALYGWIFLSLVFGFDYLKFIIENVNGERTIPIKHWPRLLLVLNTLFLLWRYKSPYFWRLFYASAIAWCASLSWGYQSPVLFLPGLIIVSYLVWQEFKPFEITRRLLTVSIYLTVIFYIFQNVRRYQQGMIWENSFHLGALNPKYSLIFTNERTFNLYKEIKKLSDVNSRTIFLPAFSDASYFVGKKPNLQLDWASDVEIRGDADRVLQKLASCQSAVLLFRPDFNEEKYSVLSRFIKTHSYSKNGVFDQFCE